MLPVFSKYVHRVYCVHTTVHFYTKSTSYTDVQEIHSLRELYTHWTYIKFDNPAITLKVESKSAE